jgi:hypothetical protein
LPEYFSPTSLDKGVRSKGVGLVNDLRMKDLQGYLTANGAAQESGALVRDTVTARRLTAPGYAAAWGLTHFLAERSKEKFFAYLAEVSKLEPLAEEAAVSDRASRPDRQSSSANGSPAVSRYEALFNKYFGSDYAALERDLLAHLQSLPYVDPIENMTHYVCMLQQVNGGRVQRSYTVTISPADVRQWQQESLGAVPPALQPGVSFSVQAFPSRAGALSFAKSWLNSD